VTTVAQLQVYQAMRIILCENKQKLSLYLTIHFLPSWPETRVQEISTTHV